MLQISAFVVILIKLVQSDQSQDSYLKALRSTHHLNEHKRDTHEVFDYPVYQHNPYAENINQVDYDYQNYPNSPSDQSSTYHQETPSLSDYEKNRPVTHRPSASATHEKQIYGPPNVYGPPVPVYVPHYHHIHHGAPTPVAVVQPQSLSFTDSIPYAFLSLWDRIKLFKWDLFKFGKLFLAVIIFKKFLSFVTILFLLYILPKFEKRKKKKKCHEDCSDGDRKIIGKKQLNEMTQYILASMGQFEDDFSINATITKN